MAHQMILRRCLITAWLKKSQYRQSSCKYFCAPCENMLSLLNYVILRQMLDLKLPPGYVYF